MGDGTAPYHAHIYYSPDERSAAERLRAQFQASGGIMFVGQMVDRGVGPHPIPQYEVHFPERSRPAGVEAIEQSGLRALVHPLTADDLALVKQVAKAMLETLKREKLVLDWRLKERAKAAVRSAIQQSLDVLPSAYNDVIWQGKVAQTSEWIFDHYGGAASIN